MPESRWKYGQPKGRYLVEVDEDGVIHLYPAAVMTELEAAMWRYVGPAPGEP